MIKFIKQLLCKHIYKSNSKTFLRDDVVRNMFGVWVYNYYLEELQCVKCQKIKKTEISRRKFELNA